MESIVSDSVGRQSDDDGGGWNDVEAGRGSVEEQEVDLGREPVSFVEFTSAANDEEDTDVGEHPRRKRSLKYSRPSSVVLKLYLKGLEGTGVAPTLPSSKLYCK